MIDPWISGDVTLYLGDCLDILPTLAAGSVDAVVTDPPYGIKINNSNRLSKSRGFGDETWDEERLTNHISAIYDKYYNLPMVIWGGNYYADVLPVSRGWLIWDKVNDRRDFGEAELAWTNRNDVIRIYEKWPIKIDNGKIHPTQKPIEVIKWCMEYMHLPSGLFVFDPFMGSGTTGVACVQTGRKFIGIEIDPKYFEIAKKRIEAAQQQIRMPI